MSEDGDTFSRQPPGNVMAEMALLGALLANNKVLDQCVPLKPEHFIGEGLGAVFSAIKEGVEQGRTVTAVSLKSRFDNTLLASLLTSMVSINTAPGYARVVRDDADRRSIIAIGQTLLDGAYAQLPVEEVRSQGAAALDRLVLNGIPPEEPLGAALGRVMAALNNFAKRTALHTGFTCLDERLGGLDSGLVYVLGGRPAMGKSALANQIALNVARQGVGVLIVSLEMSAEQIGIRTLALQSGVSVVAIRRGKLSPTEASRVVQAHQRLRDLPLVISDAAGQTPSVIAAKARESRRRHGLGLVVIDHLNLMKPESQDARHGGTWATGQASHTVLQIAKDCGVPAILCVQLNRGPENREDKRPHLADLRQSGDIEQDAHAVGLLYRPEYYLGSEPGADEPEALREQWERRRVMLAGRSEVIWAKLRDGAPGTDLLQFHAPTTSFSENGS